MSLPNYAEKNREAWNPVAPIHRQQRKTDDMINVFEVLDNFLGSGDCPVVEALSNKQIEDLRHHILKFYNTFDLPLKEEYETRLFLGSFLSSPPFPLEASPYLSSAILCADAVVFFDPLHHWFCEEQYLRTRLQSASSGWLLDVNTKRPDYIKTRQYLNYTFSWLYSLRPLIDAGIIVLVPAEKIIYSDPKLETLSKEIKDLLNPLEILTEDFSPEEITVDDNRKGLFVFAGGSRVSQLRKALGRGIEHFAKDVIIANKTDSVYTAPFRWEQELCKRVFNEHEAVKVQTNIVEGIRNLKLPLLANLSPEILAEVHKDSYYYEFRAGLSGALRAIDAEIGTPDFSKQVREIERDILLPKIRAIHQEVKSSRFQKLTKVLPEGLMTFAQTFLVNLASGIEPKKNLMTSGITGLVTPLIELIRDRAQPSENRIWIRLLPEKPSLPVYGSPLTLKKNTGDGQEWEIDSHTSHKIRVSSGVIKFPLVFQPSVTEQESVSKPTQSASVKAPRNAPCPCGSGRKYKHCCGKKKTV